MVTQGRMSPMTALVIGVFGVGAVGIASVTAVVLHGFSIIDSKAGDIIEFAETALESTLEGLPVLLDSLPEAVEELLNDRRAGDYAANLDVAVRFIHDEDSGRLRPVLAITNEGERVVSLLAVRVVALNGQGIPMREWTEIVATPITIPNEWRGPLRPGNTRHVILSSWRRGITRKQANGITGAVEITDVRVWNAPEES